MATQSHEADSFGDGGVSSRLAAIRARRLAALQALREAEAEEAALMASAQVIAPAQWEEHGKGHAPRTREEGDPSEARGPSGVGSPEQQPACTPALSPAGPGSKSALAATKDALTDPTGARQNGSAFATETKPAHLAEPLNESAPASSGSAGLRGFVGTCSLSADEVRRYSRQMLLPAFGIEAQERLKATSVVVIGAGGLGSPIALYLAAGGVGKLGIVDRDQVDVSNLHRQIVHSEASVGKDKVDSAAEACGALNSHVPLVLHREGFTPDTALDIADAYDIIVDASDNVTTRYLINDAAVVAKKSLVFGAALGVEGQITVYNHNGGPCYRCLFPAPPPPAACQRCADAGVLGVVPGVIGVLQAVEAIKIGAQVGDPLVSRMLHYDALSARFMSIKLRGRASNCAVCGDAPTITRSSIPHFDYEEFTSSPFHDGGSRPLELVGPASQISNEELARILRAQEGMMSSTTVLLDVRPGAMFKVASLPGAINIPLKDLPSRISEVWSALKRNPKPEPPDAPSLVTVCRKGNDSQRAVLILESHGIKEAKSLVGGLHAWSLERDSNFPVL